MNLVYSQRGSVLIISLLLLIVTTLLGLSSMNNTIMEEKMAGNLRQNNLALQSAESALREGEATISNWTKSTKPEAGNDGTSGLWIEHCPEDDGNGGYCPTLPVGNWWASRDHTWWTEGTTGITEYTNSTSLDEINAYFLIEELDPVSDTLNVGQQQDVVSYQNFYQVTAYGTGMDQRARVYLRSTFIRRF